MKTKILIDIEDNKQHVEIVGTPCALLIELSSFLSKQKEFAFILKTALKFAPVIEKDFNDYEAKINNNPTAKQSINDYSPEAFAIIDEFIEHYQKNFVKKS